MGGVAAVGVRIPLRLLVEKARVNTGCEKDCEGGRRGGGTGEGEPGGPS